MTASTTPDIDRPTAVHSSRNPQRGFRILTLAMFALLQPKLSTASDQPRGTLPPGLGGRAATYEAILQRVQAEPLLGLTDPRVAPGLIMGSRRHGVLRITVGFHDPLNPKVIEVDLPNWTLAARANLLVSYARVVTDGRTPRPYVGVSETELRSLLASDADERARIREIVRAGGYTKAWKPFVTAYRKLLRSADRSIPPGDTTRSDTQSPERVAGLAQEGGMLDLIYDVPIDPRDVTNEIIRVLLDYRRRLGGVADGSDIGRNLLYTCGDPVEVHIHSWHGLAPALFRATESVQRRSTDSQARLIMTILEELGKEIGDWNAAHPDASPAALDNQLNEMATARGLYSLLKE